MTLYRRRSFLLAVYILSGILYEVPGFAIIQRETWKAHRSIQHANNQHNADDGTSDSSGGLSFLSGYKFGDLSRSIAKKAASSINEITGKEGEYEFGDLSRWADAQAKAKLANYTGNDVYEFGDVSKEILRRVSTGEYSLEDMMFLCRALLSFGVGLTPVASALPVKLLLEMINVSLAEEVGGRLLGALATALDERFKESLTGDAKYELGDKTREAILQFTGKKTYSFGDISRAIASKSDEKKKVKGIGLARQQAPSVGAGDHADNTALSIDAGVLTELEEWDRHLKEKSG